MKWSCFRAFGTETHRIRIEFSGVESVDAENRTLMFRLLLGFILFASDRGLTSIETSMRS